MATKPALLVRIEPVSVGVRCDRSNQPALPLPEGWTIPGCDHGHGSPIAPCVGKQREVFRPPRMSEKTIAVVEFKARQVECPKCGAKPKAFCTREDGTTITVTHTERMVAGQNVKVKVVP